MLTKDKAHLRTDSRQDDGAAIATFAWIWRQFVRGIWGGVIAVLIVAACAAAYFLATPPQVFRTAIEFAREPVRTPDGFVLRNIDFTSVPRLIGKDEAESSNERLTDSLTAVFRQKAYQVWNPQTVDLSKLEFTASPYPDGITFSTVGTIEDADSQKKLHQLIAAELMERIALTRKAAEDYAQYVLSDYKSDLAGLEPLNIASNRTLAKYRSAEQLDKILDTLMKDKQASASPSSGDIPSISIADDSSIANSATAMLDRREAVAAGLHDLTFDAFTLQTFISQSHPEELKYVALQTNQQPLVKNGLATAAFIFLALMGFLIGPFVWATALAVRDELRARPDD